MSRTPRALCAIAALGLLLSCAASAQDAHAAAPVKRHVVLIVWDGMRPDFVSKTRTPNLAALAERGVTFARHHSVYLTSTEVNGAALATGAAPRVNGIMANVEFRPDVDASRVWGMEEAEFIERCDAKSKGGHLKLDTLPELARAQGLTTCVAGTKPVVRLFDRTLDDKKRGGCVMLAQGETLPAAAGTDIAGACGPFPSMTNGSSAVRTKAAHDAWTTRAMCEGLWAKEIPAVSVLWLGEPDYSQHLFGPGVPEALEAIKHSDECLGVVIDALTKRGVLDQTDVLVVSDHGFSTITGGGSAVKDLKSANFDAVTTPTLGAPTGQVLVVSNSGSVLYYVNGHDEQTTRRLVDHLKTTPYAGVIFTRAKLPGTFGLAEAMIDTPDAPDVVVAARWSPEALSDDRPLGMVWSDGGRKPGQGTHVSLSAYDTHNTLIAAGPDFKKGVVSMLPSGNADVTPTLCKVLNITPDKRQTGRVLSESLVGGEVPATGPVTTMITAVDGAWGQYLTVTTFDGRTYIDEGGQVLSSRGGAPAAKP